MYQMHLGAAEINEFPVTSKVTTTYPSTSTPTPVVSAPTASPQQVCQQLFAQWDPAIVACLTSADHAQVMEICEWGVANPANQQKAAEMIQKTANAACARNRPPAVTQPTTPPAPPATPQPNQPPPAQAPPAQDFPGGPSNGGAPPNGLPSNGGSPGGATSAQTKKPFLQQLGPIVGIGLLAAVGLTVARKRALTKRRRKK